MSQHSITTSNRASLAGAQYATSRKVKLNLASFRCDNSQRVILKGRKLDQVGFNEADLKDATIKHCTFDWVDFREANLTGVNKESLSGHCVNLGEGPEYMAKGYGPTAPVWGTRGTRRYTSGRKIS